MQDCSVLKDLIASDYPTLYNNRKKLSKREVTLKAKRGFEVDFFKKCVPGLHEGPYIFPKHDPII